MSMADYYEALGSSNEYEEELEIRTLSDLNRDIAMSMSELSRESPEPYRVVEKMSAILIAYKELISGVKTELDLDLINILGADLRFNENKEDSLEKKVLDFNKGLSLLKELNHPKILVLKDKYVILTEKQKEALYKECPTCNFCETEMKDKSGAYGIFYYCEQRCKGQKTISKEYWDKTRRIN